MSEPIAKINDFFDSQKQQIYSALVLLGVIDLLFAVSFAAQYSATHTFRDYMVFGSPMHFCSWLQFLTLGGRWLAFANLFFFLPAITFSMLLPHMVEMAKKAQEND